MGESPSSALPQLSGLTIEAVEWLPSGADSGLVRVRGRWSATEAARPGLPELVLRAGGIDHRFESLPDARFARDPASWRGSYLVPVALVAAEPELLWVEWPGGVRSGLPPIAPGLARPAPMPEVEPESEGGQLIDRGVLAERRARRAEAAEKASARVAAEALRAVEALELQSAELERRLAETTAERDSLADEVSAPGVVVAERDALAAEAAARAVDVAELERIAARRQAALAGALDSLARLRRQSREWRLKLRTGEIAHAGDAVRLAVLEAERATAGEAVRAAERAAEERLGRVAAELEAARDEVARGRAELDEAREQAEGRVAAALAAAEETRESLERRHRGERVVLEEVREALQERLDAAETRTAALEAAQAELSVVHESAEARAASLHARVTELETALASTETLLHTATTAVATTEAQLRVESVARAALEDELDRDRDARATLAAERDTLAADLLAERDARAALAADLAAERDALAADLVAEREARAADREALTADLIADRDALAADREGLAADLVAERDALAADLVAEREARAADRDAFAAELAAERATRAAERDAAIIARDEEGSEESAEARTLLEAVLAAERDRRITAEAAVDEARTAFEADLADARAARDAAQEELMRLRAELEQERDARAAADAAAAEASSLQDRIAELDRHAAGLAAEVRLEQAAREQAEAAATATPPPQAETGRILADLDAAAAALRASVVTSSPQGVDEVTTNAEGPAAAEVETADEVVPAAVAPAPERARPTIISAPSHPPRIDAAGRSARQYPALRGAIVKLAHDDPVAAGRLLAALLPAQGAALANPLDYDLTIREVGTFAVTVGAEGSEVREVKVPRPRDQADFHLTADALTLAELLAGVPRHVGRIFGPAKFRGSKRSLAVLRALPATHITIAEAARAGAQLAPGLVYRALSYAVHPSWTRGERFTVAQEITGEAPETWYLTARDGAGLDVSDRPPQEGADATVTMTAEAFALLLRGEAVPSGRRPAVRGDRSVVARMKAWTDRAQGLA